jgi:hypothetical protein
MKEFASVNSSRFCWFTCEIRKRLLVKYGDVMKVKMEEIASCNNFACSVGNASQEVITNTLKISGISGSHPADL